VYGRSLDVGFGTGAIRGRGSNGMELHGFDLNWAYLNYARTRMGVTEHLTNGDAYHLPYADNCFDRITCHFFLLWIPDPMTVIEEMVRVCKPGGTVLFFAEPDYGGRIDYPELMDEINQAQIFSLKQQGADPFIGRKILDLATHAGLTKIEVGIIGFEAGAHVDQKFWESEWATILSDLEGILPAERLYYLQAADEKARLEGRRITFVPTFYLYSEVG
jgi:SAM-dependent methyltransferase